MNWRQIQLRRRTCRGWDWGSGTDARQARLVVPVSMGHSRSDKTGATSLACLIRADPRPNKSVAK